MKISLIAFLICMGASSPAYLQKAEKALQESPDSCLVSLLQPAPSASARSRARHALLLSLALDKNFIDVTDDSLARSAAEYFARHGSRRERMLSRYSLGRVRSNRGDRIGALLSFQEAEELCRQCGDAHYLGLILRNEGELYGATHDYRQQQQCYARSAAAFGQTGEKQYAAYSLLALARSQAILGDEAGADSLLRSLLRNNPPAELEAEICRTLASAALDREPPRADSVLYWFARCSDLGMPLSPGEELERGVAFALLGAADSAQAILAAAREPLSAEESVGMAHNRAWIRSLLGQDALEDIRQVAQEGGQLFNKDIHLSLAGFVGDYYRQEVLIREQRTKLRALMTVFPLLLLLLMAVWSWLRFRERERAWDATMVSTSLLFQEQGSRLSALLKGRARLLKDLADLYVGLDESDAALLRKKDMDRMELIVRFRKGLHALRKDTAFWNDFASMLDREQDGLATKLSAAFPRIREEDRWILLLLYAGIPATTVGILFGKPAETVRTRKSRFLSRIAASGLLQSEKDFFTGRMPS